MNSQKIFQWVGYFVGAILALSLIVTLGQMWSQWIIFLVYLMGSYYIVKQTWMLIRGQQLWIKYGVMAAVIILLGIALNSYLGITIKITPPNPPPIKWPERPTPITTIDIPLTSSVKTTGDKEQGEKSTPCRRIPTLVTKNSEGTESIVLMNGKEKDGVNAGLILKPGEEFRVEQIFSSDEKKNRISYDPSGASCPIWGGNDFSSGLPVKYKLDRTVNGVVVIVRDLATREEKVFSFNIRKTILFGKNPFPNDAKVVLYYNCILWEIKDGRKIDGHGDCGLDGATATLKVVVVPKTEEPVEAPLAPTQQRGGKQEDEILELPDPLPENPLPIGTQSPENSGGLVDPNIFEY